MSDPQPTRPWLGTILVVLSGLSFGSLSVFNRQLGQAGISVPMMLTLRFALGAAVLWALVLARGEARRVGRKAGLGFLSLGCLYVAQAWAYFESAARIPIALTALLLYAYPVVVAVAQWLLTGEAIGRRGLVALAMSSAGVALAVGAPSGALDPRGVALGLATAVFYATYVLVGARGHAQGSALLGSAWLTTVAAALFSLGALATGTWDLARCWAHPVPLLGLALLGTALPIPLLLAGLPRLGPTQGAIFSSVEPISTALCGALFLDERLTGLQLLGAGLVLLALVVRALGGAGRSITHPRAARAPSSPG